MTEPIAAGAVVAPAGVAERMDEFSKFLDGSVKNEKTRSEVNNAVQTLTDWVLKDTTIVSDDALRTIKEVKKRIDGMLTAQINTIMHTAAFQKLEGTWRGLHHLVSNSETGTDLQIRVLNISKKELGKTLKKFSGTSWDQSPIFKKIYSAEYDILNGTPYGCIVGDYEFDHSADDVDLLTEIAKTAAAAHAPFVASASPSLFKFESWGELSRPSDLAKIQNTAEYAAWRQLRESEDSRYLALTMPRFLSRLPYGAKTRKVEEFAFEEETGGSVREDDGTEHDRYTWSNSSFAMGALINRSFKETGWFTRIRGVESGGNVFDLPVHTFPTDDGGVDMQCPTEIAITGRRSGELDRLGLLPLEHHKGEAMATFLSSQTLQKPAVFDKDDATRNAALSARLPYIMATSRFAHYLKMIARAKIGSLLDRNGLESFLHTWISGYVNNLATATEAQKARQPLKEAKVVVKEDESNPGFYSATFYLNPHVGIEGLSASMRLVSRIPADK